MTEKQNGSIRFFGANYMDCRKIFVDGAKHTVSILQRNQTVFVFVDNALMQGVQSIRFKQNNGNDASIELLVLPDEFGVIYQGRQILNEQ